MPAKLTDKLYREICLIKNITPLELYTNMSDKLLLKCNSCSFEWRATFGNIKKKTKPTGCPACGEKKRVASKTRSMADIISFFKTKNINFLSDEYKGYEYMHALECIICKHLWNNSFGKIISGRKCPKCTSTRLHMGRPAILYLLVISTKDESFLKIGITKQKTRHRMSEIKYDIGECTIRAINECNISTFFKASEIESCIIKKFASRKHSPIANFGGKNECFEISSLHDILEALP